MKKDLLVIPAAVLLAACATPLPQMPEARLCQHYGNNRQSNTAMVSSIRAEVISRQLLTTAEIAAVERGQLQIGMSTCAMYSVLGSPHVENRTTTAGGTSIQHGFVDSYVNIGKRRFVYTQDGRVTAWQD